jgi:DNA polymerase V
LATMAAARLIRCQLPSLPAVRSRGYPESMAVSSRTWRRWSSVRCGWLVISRDVEDEAATKAQILVSRSFPDPIWDPELVWQAVAEFAQRAAHRLRKEGEVAGRITVFVTTSPHRPGPTHNVSAQVRLAVPTNQPGPLVAAARAALVPKLLHGMSYMRAGILCLDLAPDGAVPLLPGVLETPAPIGELIDAVNARFGTGILALGRPCAHSPVPWANRQADLSPRYTTDWNELRTVS